MTGETRTVYVASGSFCGCGCGTAIKVPVKVPVEPVAEEPVEERNPYYPCIKTHRCALRFGHWQHCQDASGRNIY